MKRRKSLLLKTLGIMLVLFAALAVSTTVLAAASYPSKPVRLIVPDVAGGGQDIVARLISADLSERLGKPVVVEYRSGAGGIIGTEAAAKADPDGYTLFLCAGKFTIQPALENLPYDPVKSFIPIAKLGGAAYALVVNPSVPANSVKELIALAKQKPGQPSDEAKKRFLNAGMEADYLGSTEFGPFIEGEINRWASVVKKGNIKLEK